MLSPAADGPTQAPEMKMQETPATFQTRVNLVTVPVVVRDKKGHAVGGLTQDSFQLLDRGKPQMILKFSMERQDRRKAMPKAPEEPLPPGSTPVEGAPERFLAYVVDDVHLKFADLAQVRNAAIQHLENALTPTTRAAVYTTSGRTILEYTDDRAAITKTLLKIMPLNTDTAGMHCPDLSFYYAERIQNSINDTAYQIAVEETIHCAALEDLPNAAEFARAIVTAEAGRVFREGEYHTRVTFSLLKEVVRRMSTMPGSRNLILLSGGFPVAGQYAEESEIVERGIRAGITINAVDARGLWVLNPAGDITKARPVSFRSATLKAQLDREAMTTEANVLAELSHGTAGTFVENTNDLKGGLDLVAAPPEFYYLLAFSPQNLKIDGKFHQLKVVVKDRKNLTVQARHGYFAPKEILDPAQAAKAEIAEALFSRDEFSDIPVQVSTRYFKTTDTSARLAVIAKLEAQGLRFRKSDSRNHNTVTVVTGLFDRNGNFIDAIQKKIEFQMRDVTLEQLMRSGIAIKSNFDVTPGTYAIRVVVRDSEAHMMAARNAAIEIP